MGSLSSKPWAAMVAEGIQFFDGPVGMSQTLRNYRASCKYSSYEYQWKLGHVYVTNTRLMVTGFINITWTTPGVEYINVETKDGSHVVFSMDMANIPAANASGRVRVSVRTKKAVELVNLVTSYQSFRVQQASH